MEEKNIKMSVIIPIFNMEKYLPECLDSIVRQTLEDIEIICVDDGSKDNSVRVIEDYALNYKNLRVLSQTNHGAGHARNQGLKMAKGEYVCFMDPDDFYPDADVLENLYCVAKRENVNICGGSFNSFINGKIITEYYESTPYYVFEQNKMVSYSDYQWEYGFTRFCYNLKFLRDNDIYFPEYARYEDPPFFVKAMIVAGEFYAIKKVTYMYREQYKPLVLSVQQALDMLKGMEDILDMAKANDYYELYRLTLLRFTGFKQDYIKFLLEENEQVESAITKFGHKVDCALLDKAQNKQFPIVYPLDLLKSKEVCGQFYKKEKKFIETVKRFEKIAIYGNNWVTVNMKKYFEEVVPEAELCSFIWANEKEQDHFENIPIYTINELLDKKDKVLMEVVVLDESYTLLIETLKKLGFLNIIELTLDEYNWIIYKDV